MLVFRIRRKGWFGFMLNEKIVYAFLLERLFVKVDKRENSNHRKTVLFRLFKVRRDCRFCTLQKVREEKRKMFLVRESVRKFLLLPLKNLGRFVYGGL